MKTLSILFLSLIIFTSCNSQSNNKLNTPIKRPEIKIIDTIFTFENTHLDKVPPHWSVTYTGRKGEIPTWKIINDNGNKVLAQLSKDNPNYHFNVVTFDDFEVKNIELQVKMKGVHGNMDQGGGFVWRYTDKNNYYVVRANPLEDNVVLYKVKNGKRTDLPIVEKGRTYGVDVKPLGNKWNTLKLKVKDNLFTIYLNDQQIFQVQDTTFSNSGKIGLWTKADAITYFDDFQINKI
jgi:hypothetical protein